MSLSPHYLPVSNEDRTPLSYGQEQLWFLAQLSPADTTYNIGKAFRLSGPVDRDILRRSIEAMVDRHQSMRATFGSEQGVPFQVTTERDDEVLLEVDLTMLDIPHRQFAVEQAIADEAATPFDLETGPLYRFRLYKLGECEYVFALWFHHIVSDGWSVGVLTRELSSTYSAIAEARPAELAPVETRYTDFIARQRAALESTGWELDLEYWDKQLSELPLLELPADRQRDNASENFGAIVRSSVPTGVVHALRDLARSHRVSLFMLLTAAVDSVLARYTGQDDIPVGIPVLGRQDPELENVFGLFVNMAVLRVDLAGDPTFLELIERVADANLDLYDHQDVPFDRVVDRVSPVREVGRNPLFQVSVQLLGDQTAGAALSLPGVRVTPVPVNPQRSRFDLAFNFEESSAGELRLDLEYSAALLDRWRVEAMAEHLLNALSAVASDASLRLSAIPLLSDAERTALLAAGRGELVTYSEETVHQQIADIAHRTPDAVAAVCKGKELTYAELDRRAGQLAHYLRTRGLQHEQIVGIAMDRDIDVLIAMHGVLKAGGAFAMIDPRHPASRLGLMLDDADARLVITRAEFAHNLPRTSAREVIRLDTDWPAIESTQPTEGLTEWATRDSLAYVLYTSGSTGKPKGVLVEHRAITCFTEAYRRTFDFTPADRMLQLPGITFDMSHGEIFTALTVGATLVLVSYDEGLSPDLISGLMRQERVTFAGFSPAMLGLVEAAPYPDLKYVMNGGDALPAELVNKWNLPGRRFVNLYGPTEAVIACTEYECEHVDWRSSPPIGFVHLNRQAYIVDRFGNLAPKGVPGELLIGGPEGLARGYLNAPEQTAEKFIPDPFEPGGRVYRTGDVVRWTRNLALEFIGRIDGQIKLRGLRIEPGDIESALIGHPDVQLATVLLLPGPSGERQLVGYYTAAADPAPTGAQLSRYLREHLPSYMIPTAWVLLDDFPLTAARKINRKALPAPTVWGDSVGMHGEEPVDPVEKTISGIYAEVLGLSFVGRDDDFFQAGGNSLQAMRVVSRINQAFGVKISIRRMYGGASPAELAVAISDIGTTVSGTDSS